MNDSDTIGEARSILASTCATSTSQPSAKRTAATPTTSTTPKRTPTTH